MCEYAILNLLNTLHAVEPFCCVASSNSKLDNRQQEQTNRATGAYGKPAVDNAGHARQLRQRFDHPKIVWQFLRHDTRPSPESLTRPHLWPGSDAAPAHKVAFV